MGAGKQRRANFLALHPTCCFCGAAPATTIDHIPPRAAFKERQFPESFEFPACEDCNASTSGLEQVVAFYIRAFDDDANYVPAEVLRLYNGVKNNHPELLPNFDLSGPDKRRALRDRGLKMPPGVLLKDVPLIGVPTDFDAFMNTFSEKLMRALFYKETGSIASAGHRIHARWMDFHAKNAPEIVEGFERILSNYTLGARANFDMGYQFHYRWKSDRDQVFGAIVQFSKSLFIVGAVAGRDAEGFEEFEARHP